MQNDECLSNPALAWEIKIISLGNKVLCFTAGTSKKHGLLKERTFMILYEFNHPN